MADFAEQVVVGLAVRVIFDFARGWGIGSRNRALRAWFLIGFGKHDIVFDDRGLLEASWGFNVRRRRKIR